MDLSVYFPFMTANQLDVMQKAVDYNIVDSRPPLNAQCEIECDVLAPVDEVTGHRQNPITKIMDPMTNPLERDRLASSLQRVPTSPRNRLSDDDLMSTLPSRYNQTLTDNEAFANHLVGVIDSDKPGTVVTDEPVPDPGNSDDN